MSQSIALTGATGFIGSTLARQLAAESLHLRALTRPTSSHALVSGLDIEWVQGGLDDPDALRRLVRGADTVIHCAGAVRGATREQFEATNAGGVARLVRTAAEQKPRPLFILLSSLAARENRLSHYAASKFKGEKALAAGAGDMPWIAVRPPAVYGPGDREMRPLFQWARRGVVPRFGPPDWRIPLIFVDDLARAVFALAQTTVVRKKIFELHDGHPGGYSMQEIRQTVAALYRRRVFQLPVPAAVLRAVAGINLINARLLGYAPMLTPGKVRELTHTGWTCDNGRIQEAIDWAPRIDLAEGIRRTLAGAG
jgi:nucleoside-diphosphate-sugar epimerase